MVEQYLETTVVPSSRYLNLLSDQADQHILFMLHRQMGLTAAATRSPVRNIDKEAERRMLKRAILVLYSSLFIVICILTVLIQPSIYSSSSCASTKNAH